MRWERRACASDEEAFQGFKRSEKCYRKNNATGKLERENSEWIRRRQVRFCNVMEAENKE